VNIVKCCLRTPPKTRLSVTSVGTRRAAKSEIESIDNANFMRRLISTNRKSFSLRKHTDGKRHDRNFSESTSLYSAESDIRMPLFHCLFSNSITAERHGENAICPSLGSHDRDGAASPTAEALKHNRYNPRARRRRCWEHPVNNACLGVSVKMASAIYGRQYEAWLSDRCAWSAISCVWAGDHVLLSWAASRGLALSR
jgi:hypothetical protein